MPRKKKGYVWKTPRFGFPELPGRKFYLELPIGKPSLWEIVEGKAVKVKKKREKKESRRERREKTDASRRGERDYRDRGEAPLG